jgi:hypothetical protein
MALYGSGMVGGSDRLSTWGKFRVLLARNVRDMGARNLFNREWVTGLKAEGDGSGWIRKPPTERGNPGVFDDFAIQDWQPYFIAGTYPQTPPDPDLGEIAYRPAQWSRPTVSSELQAYLSGIASSDGGDVTMNSTFWGSSGGVVANPATTVTFVDGLTDA